MMKRVTGFFRYLYVLGYTIWNLPRAMAGMAVQLRDIGRMSANTVYSLAELTGHSPDQVFQKALEREARAGTVSLLGEDNEGKDKLRN